MKMVCVVIPTYNRADQALRAIRTVDNQTYGHLRTIVVIDGSTDATASLLHEYKDSLPLGDKKKLEIIYQENSGVSAARNRGIKCSDSNFVALLDDDDLWHADKVKFQMEMLSRDWGDDRIICCTDYVGVPAEGGASEVVACGKCMTLAGQVSAGIFPPPSSWLFSRECFDAVGGFDEELHAGEDADFITRLRKIGATLMNVDEPLTFYTTSPPGKVYRDQQAAAARTLMKHDEWWRNVLDPDDYEKIMRWYQEVLPEDLYREARRQLDLSNGGGKAVGLTQGKAKEH